MRQEEVSKYLNNCIQPLPKYDFRHTNKRADELMQYDIDRISNIFEVTGGTKNLPWWRVFELLATKGYGWFYPYNGKLEFLLPGLGGERDHLYLPTKATVANPALGLSGTFNIEDGVLAKFDTECMGIYPLLAPYEALEAHAELSLKMGITAARTAYIATVGSDRDRDAFKEWIDSLENGDIAAATTRDILNKLATQPYGGQTGLLTDVIETIQYAKAAKLNAIGLDSNYNMKRESINAAEANQNADALMSLPYDILRNTQAWMDEVNERFGEYLDQGPYHIEFANAWKEKEASDEAVIEQLENPEAAGEEEAGSAEEEEVKEGVDDEKDVN